MIKLDLHMHSTISDGTDKPSQLLKKVRQQKLNIFSLTDHDDCLGCETLETLLEPGDPLFIPGIEISAQKDGRKFHILGYGYSSEKSIMTDLTRHVHDIRIKKVSSHLDWLKKEHAFHFDEKDVAALMRLPNPGKPHIARMMMKTGRVSSISEGISEYLNRHETGYHDLTPEEAIQSILDAEGIPVLAHGIYGNGSQMLSAKELEDRIRFLISLGLMGVECYYSRYTKKEQTLTKKICSKYHLFATAGSDYHGENKSVLLGDTHLSVAEDDPDIMRFLSECRHHTVISKN